MTDDASRPSPRAWPIPLLEAGFVGSFGIAASLLVHPGTVAVIGVAWGVRIGWIVRSGGDAVRVMTATIAGAVMAVALMSPMLEFPTRVVRDLPFVVMLVLLLVGAGAFVAMFFAVGLGCLIGQGLAAWLGGASPEDPAP